jgi:hypothetical protein
MGKDGQYLIPKGIFEYLAHLQLLLLVGVVLQGKNDGRVTRIFVTEIGDSLNNFRETYRTGHREPVLHYRSLTAVLYQLQNTWTSISRQR